MTISPKAAGPVTAVAHWMLSGRWVADDLPVSRTAHLANRRHGPLPQKVACWPIFWLVWLIDGPKKESMENTVAGGGGSVAPTTRSMFVIWDNQFYVRPNDLQCNMVQFCSCLIIIWIQKLHFTASMDNHVGNKHLYCFN